MGDLPYNRTEIGQPPFYKNRIDYFGPILTKQSRSTRLATGKTKQWGALFTCLNTRAVDLEIVWELTTDEFLFELRRFCSRRRYPHIKQSDNGRNFVGTESKLKTSLRCLDTKRIEEEVNNSQTKWLFNPPCSLWMSGATESMVKLTKRALKTIIKERTFTNDALHTIMTEVESTVNSPPLTNVSDNIDDYKALTSNHLLFGRRSNNTLVIKNKEVDETLKHKWEAVHAAANVFWSRWTRKYLPTLTEQKKWSSLKTNLTKGDLVLICNKNYHKNYQKTITLATRTYSRHTTWTKQRCL